MLQQQLKDQVIIVTGASQGIGRSIALACAGEGARVVVAARNATKLDGVVGAISSEGGDALSVPADLCVVDYGRCVGCGVCVSSCPVDALSLRRREEGERVPVPASNEAWLHVRAEARGISLEDVL